jgi:hypothetical protein
MDMQQLSAMLSRFGLMLVPKEESEWSDLDEPQQTM